MEVGDLRDGESAKSLGQVGKRDGDPLNADFVPRNLTCLERQTDNGDSSELQEIASGERRFLSALEGRNFHSSILTVRLGSPDSNRPRILTCS
jgi:hypothetical protein